MGRMIQMKTIPEPYRTIRIILHCLYESAIRGGLGAGYTYLPTGIRTAAVHYESTPAKLHIHAVYAKPYE